MKVSKRNKVEKKGAEQEISIYWHESCALWMFRPSLL